MGRSDNCYICGKPVNPDGVPVQMLLDRKDRTVHSLCKSRMIKTQEQINVGKNLKIVVTPDMEMNKYLMGKMGLPNSIDLFTWEGFGALWKWSHTEHWYPKFKYKTAGYSGRGLIDEGQVNPAVYARAITKYLKYLDKLDAYAADRLPDHP